MHFYSSSFSLQEPQEQDGALLRGSDGLCVEQGISGRCVGGSQKGSGCLLGSS